MATKTINLTGAEVAVTGLDGSHAHIRNDGTEVIYAAKTAGITAGADGVASIPAGQSDTIRGISGAVYLLGTGSVLIQSDDYVASPFKTSAASGGSGADEVARTAINAHSGNDEIHVTAEEKAAWNAVNYSNPNLLINPDFRINQRGQSLYNTAGYTVDRWRIADNCAVTVNDDRTITISSLNNTQTWLVYEFSEYDFFDGRQITIQICGQDGIINSATGTVPAGSVTNAYCAARAYTASGVSFEIYKRDDDRLVAQIHVPDGESFTPLWVKAEFGSIATPFCPPDPATELAKCQRYYQRLSGLNATYGVGFIGGISYATINIALANPMRIAPTITINGEVCVATANHNGEDGVIRTSTWVPGWHSSPCSATVVVDISSANDTSIVGNACLLQIRDADSYIELSAEL